MLQWVKNIAEFSDNTYGERRIQKALNALDFAVGRRKTAQLMKEANVWVRYKKKYKATTNSDHKKPVYDNELKQDFDVQRPNQAWVQDITYIWTSEGWAPIDFGVKLLTPALSQLEMNKLIINLDLSDQVINFKRSNFDFSIRNNTKEEGLEYLSLLNATNLLVCSQDYAHKNQLNVFSDITKKHRLITRNAHKSNTWENIFIKHGKLFQTHKNIQVINNSFGIQEAMIAGTGIAILPDYFIEHHYKDKIFIFNELINKTEFFLAYQPSYIAKKWANKIRTSIINAFNDR